MSSQGNAFAFQTGRWRVTHRKLRSMLSGCEDWDEFGGTCEARELLRGNANIEEHWIEDPCGAYRAIGLRSINLKTDQWAIWWLDGRIGELDVPVHGRFEGGKGVFFASDTLNGQPIDIRFTWSEMAANSARWEQAFAPAGSVRWEVNWRMLFERIR